MPFTAAHPMAVLPLLRWRRALRLDATCLVIGSMAPDIEYFMRVQLDGRYGHTLAGLFIFCLPVTLVCAAVFHATVKWPLLLVTPAALASRCVALARLPWPGPSTPATAASLIASTLIGALTHDAWDSFTHFNGYPVEQFVFLRRFHHFPGLGWAPTYVAAQYLTSAVALVVLAVVVVRYLRRVPPVALPVIARTRARAIYLACVAGGLGAALLRIRALHVLDDVNNLLVAIIAGCTAGAILGGLLLRTASRQLET